jgi:hypothetical protein
MKWEKSGFEIGTLTNEYVRTSIRLPGEEIKSNYFWTAFFTWVTAHVEKAAIVDGVEITLNYEEIFHQCSFIRHAL